MINQVKSEIFFLTFFLAFFKYKFFSAITHLFSFHLKEKERARQIFHSLVHSPKVHNYQSGQGQSQELGTQSSSPTWVAGTLVIEPTSVASQNAHFLEIIFHSI